MTGNAIWLVAVYLLALPAPGVAGSFTALPVRLTIDSGSKTETLRIKNQGDAKVTVQLDAKAWRQDLTGKDVYDETEDLVFFPKIADIEAGAEQIVRVGYQGPLAAPVEKTYRLFVEELPVTKPGEVALKFALRLGIPIFVKPQNEHREWSIAALGLTDETLGVTVTNGGNSHLIVGKITATGWDDADKETFSREANGWYALAGVSKPFSLAVSRDECLRTSAVTVAVEVDQGTKEARLDVDPTRCTAKLRDTTAVEEGLRR